MLRNHLFLPVPLVRRASHREVVTWETVPLVRRASHREVVTWETVPLALNLRYKNHPFQVIAFLPSFSLGYWGGYGYQDREKIVFKTEDLAEILRLNSWLAINTNLVPENMLLSILLATFARQPEQSKTVVFVKTANNLFSFQVLYSFELQRPFFENDD